MRRGMVPGPRGRDDVGTDRRAGRGARSLPVSRARLGVVGVAAVAGCGLADGGVDAPTGTLTYMAGLEIRDLDLATGGQERVATGYDPYRNRAGMLAWHEDDVVKVDRGDGPETVTSCWLCLYPALSPDGEWVAWNDEGDAGFGTLVAQVDSGRVVWEVTGYDSGRAAWSEDGYLVMAGSETWGTEGIAVLDVESGDLARVTDAIDDPYAPVVSPDGQWVAARSVRDDEVWLAPVGGDEAVQLTRSSIGANWPFFSPDGTRLVVTYGTQSAPELRVIPAFPDAPVDLDAGEGTVVAAEDGAIWADGPFTWR